MNATLPGPLQCAPKTSAWLVFLLGLMAWAALARGEGAPARPGLAYQVTHSVTVDPSFSPDGSLMVYIGVVAGVEQLFVGGTDGANPRQITHDDFGHEDPAWSPDGSSIAFVSLKNGGEIISLIDPQGGHVEALTPSSVRAIHPNWAPDSRSIIYCTDDDLQPPAKNNSEIDVIAIETRKITTVISGGINTYPAYSPDGKLIAFRRILGEMNSEVFIADASGANQRNRRGNYQVFVMTPSGGAVRLVANTEGRATAPVWTRDGASIYFPVCQRVAFGGDCQIFSAPAPPLPAS
jgi:TolB protein